MTSPKRCEARREKVSRYLSRNNPSGTSYQKCGRKVVTVDPVTGKGLCKACAAHWNIKEGA